MMEGSCLCSDLAYQIEGSFIEAHHCHCGFCRKEHGTPYATYGMVPASALKWVRGTEKIARYESSPDFYRAFCPRCGSIVPGTEAAGLAFVPLGNLDGDPEIRPQMHIFAECKASWWEIRDGLPQHAYFPPGIDAPVHPTKRSQDAAGHPRGSCLCGTVGFVMEGEPIRSYLCYCRRCRKARAAGHASNLFLLIDDLRFTRGEDQLVTYRVPDARYFTQVFCRACGSTMPRKDSERGITTVPMGSLDDDPGIRPLGHIYVADKAPWIDIYDDLPQYSAGPPSS